MMSFQLILVMETDEKSRSDYIYINSVLTEWYNIRMRNDIKITPVYMGGKGNFKRVIRKIENHQKAYARTGKTRVVYCFDTDCYETEPGAKNLLCEEKKYCVDKGFDFVWFCHDIEEVFLGSSVPKSEKTKEAIRYSKNQGIRELKKGLFQSEVVAKGKSNLLIVLDKYLQI